MKRAPNSFLSNSLPSGLSAGITCKFKLQLLSFKVQKLRLLRFRHIFILIEQNSVTILFHLLLELRVVHFVQDILEFPKQELIVFPVIVSGHELDFQLPEPKFLRHHYKKMVLEKIKINFILTLVLIVLPQKL